MNLINILQDKLIERKIKKSFKLRMDLRRNTAMNVPVEIIRGKYKGLIYVYGSVNIQENNVRYQYDELENGHLIDDDFVRFGGHILTYLIEKRKYYDIITRNDGN